MVLLKNTKKIIMNEKQIKAFVSFLSDNNVSLNDMYQALSGPKPGDIYFTDNSYFAYPLPGRTAKGVFVTSNCYVTNSRSSDELGYTKAKIFCFFNSVEMPSSSEADSINKNRDAINASLRKIGFSRLPSNDFWVDGDSSYEEGHYESVMMASGEVGGDCGVTEVYRKGPKIKKVVCGVLHCSVAARQLQPLTAQTSQSRSAEEFKLDNLLYALLDALGLRNKEFHDYCCGRSNAPRPGEYLLKNNYCSSHPEYGQEAGIYINADMYIPLADLSSVTLSLEDAKAFAYASGRELPDYFELRQLKKVVEKVNESLDKVGMKTHSLPIDVLASCWAKGDSAASDEQRRLIFIDKRSNVPEAYLAMQDIMENWGIKSFDI
jgi:hypothetical protein